MIFRLLKKIKWKFRKLTVRIFIINIYFILSFVNFYVLVSIFIYKFLRFFYSSPSICHMIINYWLLIPLLWYFLSRFWYSVVFGMYFPYYFFSTLLLFFWRIIIVEIWANFRIYDLIVSLIFFIWTSSVFSINFTCALSGLYILIFYF